MPSIKWMQNGVSPDSSTSESPTESITGCHRGSFMHRTGGFEAGGDKWCGMDVRVDIVSPPSLSGLYYIDRSLVYIFCQFSFPDIF